MKKIFITILILSVIIVSIPLSTVLFFKTSRKDSKVNLSENIPVYVKEEDKVINMNINQYLKEVLAGEMPAEFNSEALKAQAVAARTYLINRIITYKNSEIPEVHKGGYICTDSTHCKAWISEEKIKEKWEKDKKDTYWKKISDAVDTTDDIIITYNGSPISAVFHSTSSGYTENAKDVWGSDVEYLISVKSDGEEKSPRYYSKVELTLDEFKKMASENIENVNFNKELIGEIIKSDAGGIIYINIGNVKVKGTDFRSIYGLRSTNVEIVITDTTVKMCVKGYGHGVGMSQYGANHMAGEGKTYEEILKTYYTNVELNKFNNLNL